MKKYRNKYQVVHEYAKDIKTDEWDFTDEDHYFIQLKKGEIYRFDEKYLIVDIQYNTPISTNSTLVKRSAKKIIDNLQDHVKLHRIDYADDGVKLKIMESDIHKVMEILDKHNCGCYSSRIKRNPVSGKNLPDHQSKKRRYEEIKDKKNYDKLNKMIEDTASKIGKNKMITWKLVYKTMKDKYDIDISEESTLLGVRPINVIDSKNYYSKIFKILKDI